MPLFNHRLADLLKTKKDEQTGLQSIAAKLAVPALQPDEPPAGDPSRVFVVNSVELKPLPDHDAPEVSSEFVSDWREYLAKVNEGWETPTLADLGGMLWPAERERPTKGPKGYAPMGPFPLFNPRPSNPEGPEVDRRLAEWAEKETAQFMSRPVGALDDLADSSRCLHRLSSKREVVAGVRVRTCVCGKYLFLKKERFLAAEFHRRWKCRVPLLRRLKRLKQAQEPTIVFRLRKEACDHTLGRMYAVEIPLLDPGRRFQLLQLKGFMSVDAYLEALSCHCGRYLWVGSQRFSTVEVDKTRKASRRGHATPLFRRLRRQAINQVNERRSRAKTKPPTRKA